MTQLRLAVEWRGAEQAARAVRQRTHVWQHGARELLAHGRQATEERHVLHEARRLFGRQQIDQCVEQLRLAHAGEPPRLQRKQRLHELTLGDTPARAAVTHEPQKLEDLTDGVEGWCGRLGAEGWCGRLRAVRRPHPA